jgi:hypothetical protein
MSGWMKRALRTIPLIVAAGRWVGGGCEAWAGDQVQAWYQSAVWLRLDPRWSVGSYQEARLNDGAGELHTWIVSPRIRYELDPRFHLQVNTSWVEALNAAQSRRVDSFRVELEANPNFSVGDRLHFTLRNRVEWRWLEGGDVFNTRIRLRPQLDWIVARSGVFRGFYANNEFFYDFTPGRVTENRLVPLGLVLRPSEAVELRVFYLWRRVLGGGDWFTYHAVGFLGTLNF